MQSTLISGVVLAIAGSWATHWFGPAANPVVRPSADAPELPAEPAMDPPTLEERLAQSRISFVDWQRLVKSGLPRPKLQPLLNDYRGERIAWQGVVSQVNRLSNDQGGSDSRRYLLVMYEDAETAQSKQLGRSPAQCYFPAQAAAELETLEPGTRVAVEGTLAAPETLHGSLLGTRVYDCSLLR